jgi:hypothetical protein
LHSAVAHLPLPPSVLQEEQELRAMKRYIVKAKERNGDA